MIQFSFYDTIPNITSWLQALGGLATFGTLVYLIWDGRRTNDNVKNLATLAQASQNHAKALDQQNKIIQEGNELTREYLIVLTKLHEGKGEDNAELIELEKKRFRFSVKPGIWINGGSHNANDGNITVTVENDGEKCSLDSIERIEGDNVVFKPWGIAIPLPKGKGISVHGTVIGKHSKDAEFTVKLSYHDRANFKYESLILWKGGKTKLLETKEL